MEKTAKVPRCVNVRYPSALASRFRRHCGPRPYRPSPTSRHQRRAQPRATVRPRHFDSRPSDPVASSASFLGDCSAASASATSCFGASRAHECFITRGTKVRRYIDEIDQEIRPSTYLLTYLLTYYLLPSYINTFVLLIFYEGNSYPRS